MIAAEKTKHSTGAGEWVRARIKRDQIDKYLNDGKTFIDTGSIERDLDANRNPDPVRVREIIRKALAIEALTAEETACLLSVEDPELLEEMKQDERYAHEFAGGNLGGGSNTVKFDGKSIENPWKPGHINLTAQGRIVKENPALAERLKAEAGK